MARPRIAPNELIGDASMNVYLGSHRKQRLIQASRQLDATPSAVTRDALDHYLRQMIEDGFLERV